jgi:VCBS repeat-containing protein
VLTYALNGTAPAGLTFHADGSYSFDPSSAAYQSLGVGQSATLTVPYTATDDQGATSTANLVVTVTGTNDAPVAQASSFSVAEDSTTITGSVSATDVDANAVLAYALNGAAPAGLTFNADGSYSFDPSNAAYQSLGVGQSATLTVPYTVTDDQVRPRQPTSSSRSPAPTTRPSRRLRASRSLRMRLDQWLGQRQRCRCERRVGVRTERCCPRRPDASTPTAATASTRRTQPISRWVWANRRR